MAKSKKIIEKILDTEDKPKVLIGSQVLLGIYLKKYLKANMAKCFEREPANAFAEGNLNKLVEDILNILNV